MSLPCRSGVLLGTAMTIHLWTTAVAAGPPQCTAAQYEEAGGSNKDGDELFRNGDAKGAMKKYELARASCARLSFEFKIGRALRAQNRIEEARGVWAAALKKEWPDPTRDAATASAFKDIQKALRETEPPAAATGRSASQVAPSASPAPTPPAPPWGTAPVADASGSQAIPSASPGSAPPPPGARVPSSTATPSASSGNVAQDSGGGGIASLPGPENKNLRGAAALLGVAGAFAVGGGVLIGLSIAEWYSAYNSALKYNQTFELKYKTQNLESFERFKLDLGVGAPLAGLAIVGASFGIGMLYVGQSKTAVSFSPTSGGVSLSTAGEF